MAKTFECQRQPVKLGILLKPDVGAHSARRFNIRKFYFLNLPGSGSRLPRLGCISRKPADKVLKLQYLSFLLGIFRLYSFSCVGRRNHEVIIVTRVDFKGPVIDICHVGTNSIQEMSIVRDNHHCALAFV